VKIGTEFHIHACAHEMVIPEDATVKSIDLFIKSLTKIGTQGFGTF
jgi:hypothetical protein